MRVKYFGGVIAVMSTAVFATGCSSDDKTAPVRGGQLGAADFSYGCGPDTDAQCNVDSDVAQASDFSSFPRIALGSQFFLGIKPHDNFSQTITVDFASTVFDFDATALLLKSKVAGVASILAIEGGDVLDLTWVEIAKVDHLKIIQATQDGKFQNGSISIGKDGVSGQASFQVDYKFRVIPADKDDKLLAGAFPVAWTTSDANVANITTPANLNIVTVKSGAAGTATVHVTVGDQAADIAIKVN